MLRSFRPQDFIHLPPLGEPGTLTLVEDLAAAANACGSRLPPIASASLNRLLDATTELKKTIATRERSGSNADPRARAADRALDDAWGAFQSWLLGWTRLPDRADPRVTESRVIYAALFPKGLQFLTLDFKDEWKESQERVDTIAHKGYEAILAALGGAPFVATVTSAHKAYGEALHITPASRRDGMPPATDPDTEVRRALEAAHMALREYVAQVAATVRRTEVDTVDLAGQLLLPLSDRALADSTLDDV